MHPDPIIRDLEIMSEAVNYRKWIFSLFSKYTGQRIVEIGAGIGSYTGMLLDKEIVVAVDNYEPCIEYLKRRFSRNNNVIPLKIDISAQEAMELSRYSPDTIICINVLEHILDDNKALSRMFSVLNDNGRLILMVPAHRFLYGSIDRTVGHQRRYGNRELREKITSAGFKIIEMFYMNSIAVPGWFLNNRILKRKEESIAQILFFDRFIVPWLKIIEHVIKPPFGLSLLAIAEKGAYRCSRN
jgi:2-polyprenyl-3-methyl-5-hydroxy-6-metoxy-1,4-benzoquinol methylase